MPPSSFKERMKQQREREILAAAGQLIREHGYDDMNMDALAEMVGISKPTLYQHFASKEAILLHIIQHSLEALEAHLIEHADGTPLERLELVLRTLIGHAYRHDSIMANLSARSVLEMLRSNAVVEPKGRVLAMLYQIVDEGKAQGQIDKTISTPLLTDLMFYLLGSVGRYLQSPQGNIETATNQALLVFRKLFSA